MPMLTNTPLDAIREFLAGETTKNLPLTQCSYYLPEHVASHVDYITPGVKHQDYKRSISQKKKLAKRGGGRPIQAPVVAPASVIGDVDVVTNVNCSNYVIDPACLRQLYGLPDLNADKKVNPTNAMGLCFLSFLA